MTVPLDRLEGSFSTVKAGTIMVCRLCSSRERLYLVALLLLGPPVRVLGPLVLLLVSLAHLLVAAAPAADALAPTLKAYGERETKDEARVRDEAKSGKTRGNERNAEKLNQQCIGEEKGLA